MSFQSSNTIPAPRDSFNTSSIKIDTLSGIRPLKSIQEGPFSIFEWTFFLSGSLIIFLLLFFFYKKYSLKGIKAFSFSRKDDPYLWADHQIQDLQNNPEINQSPFREYYIRLSEIIRIFIWKTSQVDAPHNTSSKSLEVLNQGSTLDSEKKKMFFDILNEADLIKFSGKIPDIDQAREYTRLALEFVRKSKTKA